MKSTEKSSLADVLERVFNRSPLGLIKYSAILRHAADLVELNEGQRDEIILLLSRGIDDPKEYVKISPSLWEALSQCEQSSGVINDYSKCLLAKALSSVLYDFVPKYKNVMASKIFLNKIANLSESIHVSVSEDFLRDFYQRAEVGDEPEFVKETIGKMRELSERRWSPDGDLLQNLEKAEKEFEDYISGMEALTGFQRGTVGEYHDKPRITSFFDPWYVEDWDTDRWGVVCYTVINVLNVQPPYLFLDALRKGLLAREAAYLFFPRILKGVDWIYEQADYCAYKLLGDNYEGDFWVHVRHGLRKRSRESDGIGFFAQCESIVGKDFIKGVFSRLQSISRFRSQIDSSEYTTVLDMLALKPKLIKLSVDELKILRILSSEPRASLTQIAQKTGLSLPTTQRLFEELCKKVDIMFSVLVDMNRIGLSEYIILLRTKPGREQTSVDALWDIPYCGRVYRTFGPMDLYACFNIPLKSEWALRQYMHQLQRSNLVESYIVCKPQQNYYHVNFRYYDQDSGTWDVHWDEWGLWLKEILYEKGWYYILQREEERERVTKPVLLDSIDLQIINHLRFNSRESYTNIGRKIGVTGVYVGQKVRVLLNQEIIRPVMGSYRIGLDEMALIAIDCDDDVAKATAVALNELPIWQGFKVSGDFEGLVALVLIPTGEIEQFFHILDTYLTQPGLANRCWLHVIGKWIGKRRSISWLPMELYSKEKGWIFEGDKYLEKLRKRLESLKR